MDTQQLAHDELVRRLDERDKLLEQRDELLAALRLLLPVARAFEKQASKGSGSRRGGQVFEKAESAIKLAEENQ